MGSIIGRGRYARETYPQVPTSGSPLTPSILTQAALFLKPQTGSDAADGLTPATAIKTWREYWRRMCVAPNAITVPGS